MWATLAALGMTAYQAYQQQQAQKAQADMANNAAQASAWNGMAGGQESPQAMMAGITPPPQDPSVQSPWVGTDMGNAPKQSPWNGMS